MISTWARTTFSALSDKHYRQLWIGTTIAFLAFSMSNVAQGVVAFQITGRNSDVGIVALGMGLATIITAPFGGVIADRVSKRILLLIGQTIICLNFTLLGVTIFTGHITVPLLFGSTFIMGLVFSFIAPARQAWIGELLHGPRLTNGIALQQVAMTATRIVGPWLAVALVAIPGIGTGGTYVAMGVLIAVVVVTLAQLPDSRSSPAGGRPSALQDMKLGVSHVAQRPRLALLAISFVFIVMLGFSYNILLPGYLHNELGRNTTDMGWMLGVAGIAGLIATVAVANYAASRHAWKMLLAGGVILGIGLMLLAVAGTFLHVLLIMLLIGAGSSIFQMLNNALIMQESDPAYYGRVMSLTMLAWGFNSLAGYPLGKFADASGERAALLFMGAATVGVIALTAVVRQLLTGQAAPLPATMGSAAEASRKPMS